MDYSSWSRGEFQNYIEFILNQFKRIDGFWFLGVEKRLCYEAAIELNEEVWQKMGRLIAREIKERFSIQQKGLEGLVKVLRFFPWAIIIGYEIDAKDNEVWVTVPHCSSQEARLKRGLGEYDCKNMHFGEFKNLVGEIDPDIQIECLFAPPDQHPKELFCKWRFTMKK